METIAFIPLRGNSKSIPWKNIRPFCGKPLAYWNLNALQNSALINKIVVATDSDNISSVIASFNFDKIEVFRRSDESATDTAPTEQVLLEYINSATGISKIKKDDILILVQGTSPLTRRTDYEEALTLFLNKKYDSLLSCVRFKRFLWGEDGTPLNYDYGNRPRRQDFLGAFLENGAFYISRVSSIIMSGNRLSGKVGIYEMPEYTSVEIDEESDWVVAEKLMFDHFSDYHSNSVNKIKAVFTDVDGVLTDSGMYYSEKGDELKKFNTKDGMAFKILRDKGIKTGILTSENTEIVSRRVRKLGVNYLFQGLDSAGKLSSVLEFCKSNSMSIKEVAYIGDDINCIKILSEVGIAACPSDAVEDVKQIFGMRILSKNGGEGVFRELTDMLLKEGLIP
jgi:N-acylneuraminate cytidylyltransferase